jgi:prepilin-type processing-associated H-X9-DG protein
VNSRSDYVYLGADLDPKSGVNGILAYERPDGRQGMNVLFTDGHVEWIDIDSANEMIKKQRK